MTEKLWPVKPKILVLTEDVCQLLAHLFHLLLGLRKDFTTDWPSCSVLVLVLQFVTEKPKSICGLLPWKGKETEILKDSFVNELFPDRWL